jgi:hypothetical protein
MMRERFAFTCPRFLCDAPHLLYLRNERLRARNIAKERGSILCDDRKLAITARIIFVKGIYGKTSCGRSGLMFISLETIGNNLHNARFGGDCAGMGCNGPPNGQQGIQTWQDFAHGEGKGE